VITQIYWRRRGTEYGGTNRNGEHKNVVRLERILTMVYVVQNSQNFSGLFPSSCIPKNMTFRKLDLFPSSGEGGREDTYSVGPHRES
jgi:hypothetical protein